MRRPNEDIHPIASLLVMAVAFTLLFFTLHLAGRLRDIPRWLVPALTGLFAITTVGLVILGESAPPWLAMTALGAFIGGTDFVRRTFDGLLMLAQAVELRGVTKHYGKKVGIEDLSIDHAAEGGPPPARRIRRKPEARRPGRPTPAG